LFTVDDEVVGNAGSKTFLFSNQGKWLCGEKCN